ncbi:MAG: class I SAM-dependent methyltransferase [Clostridia bacterium]|nr:class I SAM-dependent methyltransferase [Clostridia bacterium]
MLGSKGFDLWADGYDRSVGLSDEDGTYPFAGYRDVLNEIYSRILNCKGRDVLDIGFGTGTLTVKLYEQGCRIFGQDFSPRMIELAQARMPQAQLLQGDFANGLVPALMQRQYDAIVATYALHHLTDRQKITFLQELRPLLKEGGCIYIGDVAFINRTELEACRCECGDEWDEDEIYFVYEELKAAFPEMTFEKLSHCAGLLMIPA